MALVKLNQFYPDYRNDSSGADDINIDNFDVYTATNDKVGSVHDILVDEQTGKFRYFVVDTGFWNLLALLMSIILTSEYMPKV